MNTRESKRAQNLLSVATASQWPKKTKFGWFIMSPGIDFDRNTMLLTQTAHSDFESLCRLDVLGLADTTENDQNVVYEDFKEQLTRDPDGWYETDMPWKANHPNLLTNELGSRRRLDSLVKKLTREGNYERYDDIIREQLDQGIIERAPVEASGKEHYLPHKGVVKRSAQTPHETTHSFRRLSEGIK